MGTSFQKTAAAKQGSPVLVLLFSVTILRLVVSNRAQHLNPKPIFFLARKSLELGNGRPMDLYFPQLSIWAAGEI